MDRYDWASELILLLIFVGDMMANLLWAKDLGPLCRAGKSRLIGI